MSREGSNPEIAVDIMSIELAAVVEGAVEEDVPGRKKHGDTVADSEALGQEEQQASVAVSKTNISQDDVVSQEGEINAITETKEFSSEDQSSEIPAATDAGRKEDELDAEHKTKVAQVEDALDSLAKPVPSWDPPSNLESIYVTKYSTDIYRAAMCGDWGTVLLMSSETPAWLRTGITKGGETVVHIAAAAKHLKVIEALVVHDPSSLLYTNKDGSTPFCFAAMSGVVEIAKTMREQNNELPNIRGKQGLTPLHMAVLLGHRDMVWYLLNVTDGKRLTNHDRIEILTSCIDADMLDIALHILKENLHLALWRDARKETALHALARKPLKRHGYRHSIWRIFSGSYTNTGEETTEELELTQILWDRIIEQKEEDISVSIRHPWRLLFVAAQLGKVGFLTRLIQSYPDLIWKVDENRYSIFHTAVINRQAEIFSLIHEIGAIKDLIATYKDEEENNMLHLASKRAPHDRLSLVSGAALQMQHELQWFEAVKQIVRSEYMKAVNKDKKTPHALFSIEHETLRKEGEEWMKKTAESCALVAALITTVVFSATFQLPGGLNNDTGSPVLVKKASFVIFAMSNAVSLLASTSSILMFLSILTSRYAERDFLKSLPQKLIMGLILLLVSMATMVVGFTVTFFITFREGLRWPPIIIAILASVPITLFALQQFPLLAAMYYSTYKPQKIFSPRQNKLFHVCSSEEILAHGWVDPATHLNEVIRHRHVDHKLYNYLPKDRQLTDSDVFTMTHTV